MFPLEILFLLECHFWIFDLKNGVKELLSQGDKCISNAICESTDSWCYII